MERGGSISVAADMRQLNIFIPTGAERRWNMPIVKISMTDETFQALKQFIIAKHGLKRAMSMTIQRAVEEYLSREKKERE